MSASRFLGLKVGAAIAATLAIASTSRAQGAEKVDEEVTFA